MIGLPKPSSTNSNVCALSKLKVALFRMLLPSRSIRANSVWLSEVPIPFLPSRSYSQIEADSRSQRKSLYVETSHGTVVQNLFSTR